jgi:hypothetical protein
MKLGVALERGPELRVCVELNEELEQRPRAEAVNVLGQATKAFAGKVDCHGEALERVPPPA